jgi:hypothetical protein
MGSENPAHKADLVSNEKAIINSLTQAGAFVRLSWRDQILFGLKFEIVESTPLVESDGHNPAQSEKTHDEIPEGAEIVVELGYRSPEPSFEMKVRAQQTEGFNTANDQRDHDRHRGDRDVVVKLADGFYEGPSVCA